MKQDSEFISNMKPFFKRRMKIRFMLILFSILTAVLFVAWLVLFASGKTILAGAFGVIMLTTVGLLSGVMVGALMITEIKIVKAVLKRFGEQLDSAEVFTPFAMPDPNAVRESLGGVIKSLGTLEYAMCQVSGVLGEYPIRLITCGVNFKDGELRKSVGSKKRRYYSILELSTRQQFYHVFLDSKRNDNSVKPTAMRLLAKSLKDNKKLSVEGDVNKYFDIYVPSSHDYQSLITLSPEKLLALRDYGKEFDVEFHDNKIYIITDKKIKSIESILSYQESAINLVTSIGVNVLRNRQDIEGELQVRAL